MVRSKRIIRRHLVEPISIAASLHVQIWTRLVWERWDTLPLSEKLTWLMFAGNTLSILTVIEVLMLTV